METLNLWPDGKMPHAKGDGTDDTPTLTIYRPEKATQSAIVVCPGGGYGGHAPHEAEPIARWANSIGAVGAVVTYRVGARGYRHPAPLLDAQQAIRTMRKMGFRQVGILGFSAGGHLASTAVTLPTPDSRPDVGILIYPVIAMEGPLAHIGSRNNLLGPTPAPGLAAQLSTQTQVGRDTPPCFLMHTVDDTVVPVENSLVFAAALAKNRVPFALQVYEKGAHGVGLGSKDAPETFAWPAACAAWLKARGFL